MEKVDIKDLHKIIGEADRKQIDSIVSSMMNEIKNNNEYSFNNCISEYILPDGQKIEHQYKICNILADNYSTIYITYLYYEYKKNIYRFKEQFIKKIYERRLLYRYLELKKLLDVNVLDSESPDFICTINDKKIGIEISQAITRQEAKTDRIANNPDRYKNFEKFSNGDVKKYNEFAFSPIQSSNIADLVDIIPDTVKIKLNKIDKYQTYDKYIILIEVVNPLIDLKDYEKYLRQTCESNRDNTKVALLSNGFEAKEVMEI